MPSINRRSRSRSRFTVGIPRGLIARHRAGVTVVEVLFSIGITVVGLLGVLAILPVAGSRVTRGTIADMADRMGRNAIREFEVRHLRQPHMWTFYDVAQSPAKYEEYNGWEFVRRPSPIGDRPERVSFCIDPLFIAAHEEAGTMNQQKTWFPYYRDNQTPPVRPPTKPVNPPPPQYFVRPSPPRMTRISLRVYPTGGTGMDSNHALQAFMAQDDLVFDLPDDRTLPPVQNFSSAATKRQANGNFTWMATVSPKGNESNDQYILSIVVFHRRDLSMATDSGNERTVTVSEFWGYGLGGGDVQLQSSQKDDLELKAGDWLMLSATARSPSTGTVEDLWDVFRWYRVASADDVVGSGTTYTQNVTLQGQDWTRPEWFASSTTPSTNYPTQATLVNGVVAVYEKVICLEESSLWVWK